MQKLPSLRLQAEAEVHRMQMCIRDRLGYVLFSQGNSLEIVKSRAIELCSLLSRTAIERGDVYKRQAVKRRRRKTLQESL